MHKVNRGFKVNYTVVTGSPCKEYFKNMDGAEEVNKQLSKLSSTQLFYRNTEDRFHLISDDCA